MESNTDKLITDLIGKIDTLGKEMKAEFKEVNNRISEVNKSIIKLDEKITGIDKRLSNNGNLSYSPWYRSRKGHLSTR